MVFLIESKLRWRYVQPQLPSARSPESTVTKHLEFHNPQLGLLAQSHLELSLHDRISVLSSS
ncbi:MAG: hypothetical protein V7K38_27305 [Nostoc sp.]|uniref:hypothetical protein n=1 Tax=Nostoc sp. TaxID=1180 RepID=UPI002FF61127